MEQKQTHRHREQICGCQGVGQGRDGLGVGISNCKLLYEEWINSKVLLYSTHPSPVASVVSNSLCDPYALLPTRLLCPWDSPGQNTGGGCHALLQKISPTQGWNPRLLHLLHCRQIPYC